MYFLFGGRRKSARRGTDKNAFIFVDQYQPWLLTAALLLVTLSIADGWFTLHLIERGAYELNPIMAWVLSHGTWPFMIVKFLFTYVAVLILLVFHNFYFRPLRTKVKTIIPAFIVVFTAVLGWQLFMNSLIN